MPHTKSVFIPVQDLDDVLAPVAKHKQVTGKRIEIHGLLNQYGQTVDRLAHVGAAQGQINTVRIFRNHGSPRSAKLSRHRNRASKPALISTLKYAGKGHLWTETQ